MSIEITLPDNLTIHHISNHFSAIKDQVAQAQTQITLDAANLETFDTSGIQMLLVVIKSALEKGIAINWQNTTEQLKQGANSLGLAQELKLA